MTSIELGTLLHPRIAKHCKQVYLDGHYKHAAHEAMIQVELALKERSGVKKFGVRLVSSLFGEGKGIKLRVPFSDELQRQASLLFEGAFSYYRNYTAHDGSKIDDRTCLRVMILASELLDLIGASDLSFADVGGVQGLIKERVFPDARTLHKLLRLLGGKVLPDDDIDWIEEDLWRMGCTYTHVQAAIDTGLVEYTSVDYVPTMDELVYMEGSLPDTMGSFELTELGESVLAQGEARA